MEDSLRVTTPVLRVSALTLALGGRAILRGVNLEVGQGERVALMAPSGAGKTSILRTIVGLEAFDAGEIDVDGVRLRPGPLPRESQLRNLRAKVGIVFQFHHLFAHLTALDNVTLAPRHARGVSRQAAETRARGLLESLGVAERAHALPGELSGGEAQRVAIARALATDPPLLLLDEPTASLDPARRGELGATLKNLAATGRTLVVTTHDTAFARAYATRVVIMAEGVVVEEGEPEQVLSRPAHPATRQFLASGQLGSGSDRSTSPPRDNVPAAPR